MGKSVGRAQPVTPLPKTHLPDSKRLISPTLQEPRYPAVPWSWSLAPTKGIIIITTNAQIKANRNNAKKSTGPRTEEGKTRTSKNALKHVLLARDTVLPGEDPAEFDSQLSALEADIQPANSLEFELVRQIADSQWRMRRLTRLETGFLAAALDETRRYMEKRRPDELRPGYDGETQLLGSAMLDRTQAFVHLARYDGHLSRRFFRAVKQLRHLRHDESKAREARSSAGSYTPTDPDAYRGRYVPAQAPPSIDTPSPTAGRIGFRVSRESAPQTALSKMNERAVPVRARAPQAALTKTTKQTQFRQTQVRSTASRDEPRSADLAVEIRGLCCVKASNSSVAHSCVAHALSVPRRDSSRRLGAVQPQTTKQTQSRQTQVRSTPSRDEPRSANLAVEIRGLCCVSGPLSAVGPPRVWALQGFSASMTKLHQAPTADRLAAQPQAVSKLLVGGSANRSLTVLAPADGNRLLRSRARQQAVVPLWETTGVSHRRVATVENRTEPCPSGRGPRA